MKITAVVSFGALVVLLTACQSDSPKIQIPPKWPGAPYHLSFGPPPAQPNPSGLTIPQIKWDANPEMLQTRVDLVIQFDSSQVKSDEPVVNFITMPAVDIKGPQGSLPDKYVATASSFLGKLITAYCMNGKTSISVALTRSSIPMSPTMDQINAKRIADWTPIELDFKNPRKCAQHK